MKKNEVYISPATTEFNLELESAICAASPNNDSSFSDYDYELYPEV